MLTSSCLRSTVNGKRAFPQHPLKQDGTRADVIRFSACPIGKWRLLREQIVEVVAYADLSLNVHPL